MRSNKQEIEIDKVEFIAETIVVVGNVAAGAPILAIENYDGGLDLQEMFGREGVYSVKVRGDSMKDSGIFINTGRGPVVDEPALIKALQEGWIAFAGLDVFEKEPPDVANPLFDLENVIATPHSAALTQEAVALLAEGSAENVLRVLQGKKPSYSPNWVKVKAKIG